MLALDEVRRKARQPTPRKTADLQPASAAPPRSPGEPADRLREDLLSAVEHELRGPLGAIATWVHVLATSGGEGAAHEQGLAAIDRSVKAATRLLDDLHDLSRLAERKLPLSRQLLDLGPILQAAARKVGATAEGQTIRLPTVAVEGAFVLGDADRLARIVQTVLANSVAVAPPGGAVEARLDRAGRFWQIEVTDPLPGAAAPRKSAGRIALLLVRQLVELHGGELSVAGGSDSSTIVLRLPAAEAPAVDASRQDSEP